MQLGAALATALPAQIPCWAVSLGLRQCALLVHAHARLHAVSSRIMPVACAL